MHVERVRDAEAFLAATEQLRAADPVLTNLAGSVAVSVMHGRRYGELFWWLLRDDSDAVVSFACRSAPWSLVVPAMTEPAAAALAAAVAREDPELPGVIGPRRAVELVVSHLATSRSAVLRMSESVYVLETLQRPTRVPGGLYATTPEDAGWLLEWLHDFAEEAGVPDHTSRVDVLRRIEGGTLLVWQDGERPVAIAGHAAVVPGPRGGVGRVGPVYTPPEHRGHGYGGGVTTAVIDRLAGSCTTIMLFADAGYGPSNRLYQRLGFRAAGEIVQVDLVSGASASGGRGEGLGEARS